MDGQEREMVANRPVFLAPSASLALLACLQGLAASILGASAHQIALKMYYTKDVLMLKNGK